MAALIAPIAPFVSEAMYSNLVATSDPTAQPSVHMTDFPIANPGLVDSGLEEAMATMRQIVSLARTVRTDARLRTRQPLARAVVHVPSGRSEMEPLLELVADEINVKDLSFARSAEELAGWRAKPNFRVLGPRLGHQAQELTAVLEADAGSVAAALARGETVTVALPSGAVRVGPEDGGSPRMGRSRWRSISSSPTISAARARPGSSYTTFRRFGDPPAST